MDQVLTLVGAAASAYLIWSGLARERWTRRPRTWFLNRYPEDGHRYGTANQVPSRYKIVEQFSECLDWRTGPANVPAFIIIAGQLHKVTDGTPIRHEGQLPSPALVNMGTGGSYRLMSGDTYVTGWTVYEAGKSRLMSESEPLPKRHATLTVDPVGFVVHDGTWVGNWFDCYKCAGLWFSAAVWPAIVYGPSWFMDLASVAIVACVVRLAGNRNL